MYFLALISSQLCFQNYSTSSAALARWAALPGIIRDSARGRERRTLALVGEGAPAKPLVSTLVRRLLQATRHRDAGLQRSSSPGASYLLSCDGFNLTPLPPPSSWTKHISPPSPYIYSSFYSLHTTYLPAHSSLFCLSSYINLHWDLSTLYFSEF